MEILPKDATILSVFDTTIAKYPICLVGLQDLLWRLQTVTNSTCSWGDLEKLSGETIRQFVIDHLTSALSRLRTTPAENCGIQRFSILPCETTADNPLGDQESGPDILIPPSDVKGEVTKILVLPDENSQAGITEIHFYPEEYQHVNASGEDCQDYSLSSESMVYTEPAQNIDKTASKSDLSVSSGEGSENETIPIDTSFNEKSGAFVETTVSTEVCEKIVVSQKSFDDVKNFSPAVVQSSNETCVSPSDIKLRDVPDVEGDITPTASSTSVSAVGKKAKVKSPKKLKVKVCERNSPGAKPYVCDECGLAFRFPYILKEHKIKHSQERPCICEVCGKAFKSHGTLRIHQQTHSEKRFPCEVCGKVLTRIASLRDHMIHHSDQKLLRCSICPRKFLEEKELSEHMIKHAVKGQKKASCEVCQKTFCSHQKLLRHMLTHSDEKPFQCNICGLKFRQRYNLKSHEETHTDEKPYVCDLCGTGFGKKQYLTIHKRIHAGDLNFTCEWCGKSFIHRSALKVHERIHSGEKPFLCMACGKSFRLRSSFTSHLKHCGPTKNT